MTPSSSDPTNPVTVPSLRSPRAYTALLTSFILAMSVWLYTTPTGRRITDKVATNVQSSLADGNTGRGIAGGLASAAKKAAAEIGKTATKAKANALERTTPGTSGSTGVSGVSNEWLNAHTGGGSSSGGGSGMPPGSGGHAAPAPATPTPTTPTPTSTAPTPTPTTPTPTAPSPTSPTPSTPSGPKIEGCWSFTYQQDAQAYYVTHLDDELGLDGPKGPANGDGIACEDLPVDPNRATSIPVGGRQVAYPAKASITAQATDSYFGVAEDGVPGDSALVNKLGAQVGKAPSMIEWFSNWDESYNVDKVQQSWARGAVPVITWMPAHKGNKDPIDTSQQNILAGNWDAYLKQYADAVAAAKMPVILRFAHEQNGNWYPWSASQSALQAQTRGYTNTPQGYIDMWRHVWDVFQAEGANDYAVWAWTPIRVDTLAPGYKGMTNLADSYPGDQYVDLVGMSGYAYRPDEAWTYDAIFKKTVDQLKAAAPTKKILIAETGAAETTGTVSNTEKKAAWIADTLAQVKADPQILGVVWFNNTVVDVHTVNGVAIVTDNKWDSSPEALSAFQAALADPRFLAGDSADDLATVTRVPRRPAPRVAAPAASVSTDDPRKAEGS